MNPEDVDVQPSGEVVERTLDVVCFILSDPEFAGKVAEHNEWVTDDLDQRDIALLFLASRFTWATDLFTLRTDTLMRQLGGLANQINDLEGLVRGQQ